MNEELYNDLLTISRRIGNFRELASSESKQPLASRVLMHIAEVDNTTATEFVNEYYNRMDVKFGNGNEINNAFKKK